MPAVNTWSRRNLRPPPKTVSPIWASTDARCGDLLGDPHVQQLDSTVMPRNIVIAMRAHDRERRRGVLRLRTPERLHPVGDRLDAGQRRRARRERPREQEQRQRRRSPPAEGRRSRRRDTRRGSERSPTTSVSATISTNPYVGSAKSVPASFTPRRFASVTSSDEPDRDRHAVLGRGRRRRRGDRDRARRDAHRDRQHVVGQDRGRRDQPGYRPEVLAGDDVGAAAASGTPARSAGTR